MTMKGYCLVLAWAGLASPCLGQQRDWLKTSATGPSLGEGQLCENACHGLGTAASQGLLHALFAVPYPSEPLYGNLAS